MENRKELTQANRSEGRQRPRNPGYYEAQGHEVFNRMKIMNQVIKV